MPAPAENIGLRKAAILLVLLGDEAASLICRNLPPEDLQNLTREISRLGPISPETASRVLDEYHQLTVGQQFVARGGADYASQLLVKAFDEDTARNLLNQTGHVRGTDAVGLEDLQRTDPRQLAKFLQGEQPQTAALVLAHLKPNAAAELLTLLPDKARALTLVRLAEMQPFSPEVAGTVSAVLQKKLQSLGIRSRRGNGGIPAAAELVDRLQSTERKSILEAIEQNEPKLASAIRQAMFSFEEFLRISDSGMRELLSHLDMKTLAIALKGATAVVRNHFFQAMSSRSSQLLSNEMESLGTVRPREVAQAQQATVGLAHKLKSQGKLTLKTGGEEANVA